MYPWVRSLDLGTSALSIAMAVVVFAIAPIGVVKRKRIAELMETRPYPEPSKYRWLFIGIGAALLVGFEFLVMPHLIRHLSLRYHLIVGIGGAIAFVALNAALLAGMQRVKTWPVAARLRTMYLMLAASSILAAAALFGFFF